MDRVGRGTGDRGRDGGAPRRRSPRHDRAPLRSATFLLPALVAVAITTAEAVTPSLLATRGAVADVGVRLAVDLLGMAALVGGASHRRDRRADLVLAGFGLNLVVFLAMWSLAGPTMTLGAAFGLLVAVTLLRVVYAVLRARTEPVSATEEAGLVLAGALGLVLAVAGGVWQVVGLVGAVASACALGLARNRRDEDGAIPFANPRAEDAGHLALHGHGGGRPPRGGQGDGPAGAGGPPVARSDRAAALPRGSVRPGG
jgi:hypothetical protein